MTPIDQGIATKKVAFRVARIGYYGGGDGTHIIIQGSLQLDNPPCDRFEFYVQTIDVINSAWVLYGLFRL